MVLIVPLIVPLIVLSILLNVSCSSTNGNNTVVKSGLSSGRSESVDSAIVAVKEAINDEDWAEMAEKYHKLQRVIQEAGKQGDMMTEAAVNNLKKVITEKIPKDADAFNYNLPWLLPHYRICKVDNEKVVNNFKQILAQKEIPTLFDVDVALKDKQCIDDRSFTKRQESFLELLLDNIDDELLKKANFLLEEFYNNPKVLRYANYYLNKSTVAFLEGKELNGLKFLADGLRELEQISKSKSKMANDYNQEKILTGLEVLTNHIASLVGQHEAEKYEYKEILKSKLPELANVAPHACQKNWPWREKLENLNSWDDAIDKLDEIFEDCPCKKTDNMEFQQMKRALQVFLLASKFSFNEAQSVAMEGFAAGRPSAILKKTEEYRKGLARLLANSVVYALDNARKSEKALELKDIYHKVASLLTHFSNKDRMRRENEEARQKREDLKEKERIATEEKLQKLEAERLVKASQEPIQHVEPIWLRLDSKVEKNSLEAERAERETDSLLKENRLWDACKPFGVLERNGRVEISNFYRSNAIDLMNGKDIIEAYLCYGGGSRRYAIQKIFLKSTHKAAVKKIRQEGLSNFDYCQRDILNWLVSPDLMNFSDLRDACTKAKDVAAVLAKSHHFDKACQVIEQGCQDEETRMTAKVSLLGHWWEEINVKEFKQHDIMDASDAVNFIQKNSPWITHNLTSSEANLQAVTAIYTFIDRLNRFIGKKLVDPVSLEQAMQLYPDLVGQLNSSDRIFMDKAILKARPEEMVDYLPLIEEWFTRKSKQLHQESHAWRDYTYLLFLYYRKTADRFMTLKWLDEGFPVRTSLQHEEYLHEYKKLRDITFRDFESICNKDPGFTKLAASLKNFLSDQKPLNAGILSTEEPQPQPSQIKQDSDMIGVAHKPSWQHQAPINDIPMSHKQNDNTPQQLVRISVPYRETPQDRKNMEKIAQLLADKSY